MKSITLVPDEIQYITESFSTWFCTSCMIGSFPFNCIENDIDFITSVSNLNQPHVVASDYLTECLFQPFELNDEDHRFPLSDVDPDLNNYSSINYQSARCNYYLEDTFNSEIDKKIPKSMHSFSICHTNIRSAKKNLGTFENYLHNLEPTFKAIAVTET